MFEHAAKLNWEGIISKTADAPYRSERNESWLKIKTVQKGKFPSLDSSRIPPVLPHSSASGKARSSSTWEKSGRAGPAPSRAKIRKQLDTVVSPKSKLTKPIRKPKATWVEPTFVADIEYRDITSEGLLRASSFKGLSKEQGGRDDVCPSCMRALANLNPRALSVAEQGRSTDIGGTHNR
jgi:bifunctional non-homologous end joining protein LigD